MYCSVASAATGVFIKSSISLLGEKVSISYKYILCLICNTLPVAPSTIVPLNIKSLALLVVATFGFKLSLSTPI